MAKSAEKPSEEAGKGKTSDDPKKRSGGRSRKPEVEIKRITRVSSAEYLCPFCEKWVSADFRYCPNDNAKRTGHFEATLEK